MTRAICRTSATSSALAALVLLGSCAESAPTPAPAPPAAVVLQSVAPLTIVPGTRLILTGTNFSTAVQHTLRLVGTGGAGTAELTTPVTVVGDRGEATVDTALFGKLGEGPFAGHASVDSQDSAGKTSGHQLPVKLVLKRHITPVLSDVGDGLVHLNSRVSVLGDGMLLGQEGQPLVELEGCFLAEGSSGACPADGTQIKIQLPVVTSNEVERRSGTFEYAPTVSGLAPGELVGRLTLVNQHADGVVTRSGTVDATFRLGKTLIHRIDQQGVALGEYLDIRGAGFVGGAKGGSLIAFSGTFTPSGAAQPRQVQFELVPGYQNGGWLRDVASENIGLGKVVKLRSERGVLDGTWTPTVFWDKQVQQGLPIKLKLAVEPVKQVVWVRFTKEWLEGLRHFGLQAGDLQIRARILEVMAAAYAGVNVDFRENEPQDFKLFAKLDLGGEDPNGLGLLGYDNTPGKDVENQRLYDWLGGVNALTQQDGYPGYGGVFLVSMLGFSEHPPPGVFKSPLSTELFDKLFDPFRPDRSGKELTAAEALAVGQPISTSGCPTSGDRVAQASCAIRVLGNVVGHTAAHELGHSLGLADPYGSPTEFHNPGDLPNRLMESGQGRPFEERAELNGKGPAVFCDEEFLYLKKILPLDPPQDPAVKRPGCY